MYNIWQFDANWTGLHYIITGLPNGPVLFCSLVSVLCLSSSVTLPPGAWAFGCRRAGRVGCRAADTARRASTVTYVPLGRHLVLQSIMHCVKIEICALGT